MTTTRVFRLLLLTLLAGCMDLDGDGAVTEQRQRPRAIAADTALRPAPGGPRVDPADFVGIVHPPDPAGIGRMAWALILGPGERAGRSRFAFEYVRTGPDAILWLSRVERRIREGNRTTSTWRVLDAVTVPWPEPGKRMQVARCHDGDHIGIAAIVDRAPEGDRAYARQAWRVDWDAERIVEPSPVTVRCEVPGAGEPVQGDGANEAVPVRNETSHERDTSFDGAGLWRVQCRGSHA